MSLKFTLAANLLGPTGAAGRTIYSGTGAPAAATGTTGDFYLDIAAYTLYGPKLNAASWSSSQVESLVGPAGASGTSVPQTLPYDFVANSYVVTPVSKDSSAVQIRLNSSSGAQLFLVDALGDVTAAGTLGVTGATTLAALAATTATISGNETIGGTLAVTGQTTLGALSVSSLSNSGTAVAAAFDAGNGTASAPAYAFTTQTDSGMYVATASTTAAVLGLSVNATQALALSKTGAFVPGTLTVGGATTLAALAAASLTLSGNASVGGTLAVTGATTLAALTATNLALSGTLGVTGITTLGVTNTGALTAASLTSQGTTQSTGHFVTTNGTVSAPTFSFVAQTDTGMYLATQSSTAAILAFTVNGAQALALAKGGVMVPGTLAVSGATSLAAALAVTGAATMASTLTVAGQITAPSLRLTQGTSTDSNSQTIAALLLPGAFGSSTAYEQSGLSSDGVGNILLSYQGRIIMQTTNGGYSSAVGNTPTSSFGTNFSSGSFTVTSGGYTPLTISGGQVTLGSSSSALPCIIVASAQSPYILQLLKGSTSVATIDPSGNAVFAGNASVGGTLGVTGATTLAALNAGASTLGATSTSTLTASATVKAPSFTVSASGGALTFGDGTTQTTAATASSAGSAATFSATSNGSASAPAYTFTGATNYGMYYYNSFLCLSSGGSAAIAMTSTASTIYGALSANGAATCQSTLSVVGAGGFQSTLGVNGLTTSNRYATTNNGSAAANAFYYTGNSNTGISFSNSTGTSSAVYVYVNGASTANAAFNAASTVFSTPITASGVTSSTTLSVTGASTLAALSATTGAFSGNTTMAGTLAVTGATSHSATVTSTTAAGTPSFVSTQGFKQTIDMGTFWSGSASGTITMPTSYQGLIRAIWGNGGSGGSNQMLAVWVAPRAGSVTGLMGFANGSLGSGNTATMMVYINGSSSGMSSGISAAGGAPTPTTAAKGTYPFSAGQTVAVYIQGSASTINQSFCASCEVEVGA